MHQRRECFKSTVQRLIFGPLVFALMMLYCFSTLSIYINEQNISPAAPCAQYTSKAGKNEQNATKALQGSTENTHSCEPKMNLMFMKTHKTASSTLLNIILRYGERHNLKFALPDGQNDFSYPSLFRRSNVKDYEPAMCFNIVCNHMRFNRPEVEKLLPHDAVFFTILRDPAELFESSFHYYRHLVPLTWRITGKDKLAEFLNNPDIYFTKDSYSSFYLKNLQFFDLGFDNNLDPEDPRVEQGIQEIADRFQVVLIAEYFEESLMLLKEALCWQMDDLLFFKLNARNSPSVSQLNPKLRAKALKWNSADWKLYRHFNATFWEKVEAYGWSRMERDVSQLRRRNAEMAAICIEGGMAVDVKEIKEQDMKPWQPFGEHFIMGYNLKKNIDFEHHQLCRKMLTPELKYLTDIGVNLWLTRLWGWIKDSVL